MPNLLICGENVGGLTARSDWTCREDDGEAGVLAGRVLSALAEATARAQGRAGDRDADSALRQ